MRTRELQSNWLYGILLLKSISSKAASILGSNSGWVCPSYLVPDDSLWDLSDVIYPLRTRDGTLRLIGDSESCSTKKEAHDILLTQSIRNIPVCVCIAGQQKSNSSPRIHSSTTSATTLLFTAPSVQIFSTRLNRVPGASICGRRSNQDIYHLQNSRFWMKSRPICPKF